MRNQYKVLSEKYNLIQENDKEDVLAGLGAMEDEHKHLLASIGKHYVAYFVDASSPFLSGPDRFRNVPSSAGTINRDSVENGYLHSFTDNVLYHFTHTGTLLIYILDEELYSLYEEFKTKSNRYILDVVFPKLDALAPKYKPVVEPLIQQYAQHLQ